MSLEEFVITYERNGEIVANLFDYYEDFIKPLDPRFNRYSFKTGRLVLCFFKDHDDLNPSMGYIEDRKHRGVYRCRCFGCQKGGNVVQLHMKLAKDYASRSLTVREACIEIANFYNIPIEDFENNVKQEEVNPFIKHLKAINKCESLYTTRDFEKDVYKLRQKSPMGCVDLNKLNSACVKMIATHKNLYD